jgi:hypothetical protein
MNLVPGSDVTASDFAELLSLALEQYFLNVT